MTENDKHGAIDRDPPPCPTSSTSYIERLERVSRCNNAETDSLVSRPERLRSFPNHEWENWGWQQKNSVDNLGQLRKIFPNLTEEQIEMAKAWQGRGLSFLLTPYILSLVQRDGDGNPLQDDPVWRQFFPSFKQLLLPRPKMQSEDDFDADKENWEYDHEKLTEIAQQKYPGRILINTSDSCPAKCMHCFRALQTNAPQKKHGGLRHWRKTLEVLRDRPDINEVILSGGDPLLYGNRAVRRLLADLRSIPSIDTIRIHTRVFTSNPYRIDQELCDLLDEHRVSIVTMQVCHPNEISVQFREAVRRVKTRNPMIRLLSQSVLLKDVNDDPETLRILFKKLCDLSVHPYYLFHCMPNIPVPEAQRTSVEKGVQLIYELEKTSSPHAIPTYEIADRSGKKRVPFILENTDDFAYETASNGQPVIKFRDWTRTGVKRVYPNVFDDLEIIGEDDVLA
jgi:lysine 2,3-aminomutase